MDPSDIDTLNNLAYTQNMLIDKIDVLPSNQLSNILITISNLFINKSMAKFWNNFILHFFTFIHSVLISKETAILKKHTLHFPQFFFVFLLFLL